MSSMKASWLIDHAYQGANADDALASFTGARYPYLGENDNNSWHRSFCLYVSVDVCACMQSTQVASSRIVRQVIYGSCGISP